ncbi:CpsD/CapB family tyrosine-protein kinase [Tahibacter amnicola]|uniref:CpsD/CapB family tyrosine-protein kinase n=1 Tax=Tahibacter amnicola TaxID=2976241 RepID=A0ABY6BEL8_9GAMM|nr:CpsD/CapB family tyrosine-protein kinase [Tahibacter amnicola]UXI66342.1 CpsD/CapB family tyrosine-protein kinase [Tahibacter amnicola]
MKDALARRETLPVVADSAVAPFTPAQLEERRIVRHDMADPRQADAFRDLRTQLLARANGAGVVTLVAPVSRGSGGSYVAVNLAAAMVFDETRTAILVDCNLRSPVLHDRLGVTADRGGLVDYLEGRITTPETILYGTGVPRLMLVPAGGRREASGDLLGSQRMRQLLHALRTIGNGAPIVLDAAAVSSAPDGRIVSELAELSVLVARYGRDSGSAVRETAAVLDPAHLAGVVFNRVP